MDENNMSEMFKKAQYMIQNNQIPDDIKNLINNIQNSNTSNSSNNSNNFNNSGYSQNTKKVNNSYNTYNNNNYSSYNKSSNSYNNNYSNSNNNFKNENINNNYNTQNNNNKSNEQNSNNSIPNIDMDTLMKLQNIMSKMKNSDNDDMSRLLLSLKPYLRDGRKDKIDDYIKLIKMGKMTQILESFGGDKK